MKKNICDKITFGDLKQGECFIDFPTPGDNEGHGGYKCGYRLFEKTGTKTARALNPEVSAESKWMETDFSKSMTVIKVIGAEVASHMPFKISKKAIKNC